MWVPVISPFWPDFFEIVDNTLFKDSLVGKPVLLHFYIWNSI